MDKNKVKKNNSYNPVAINGLVAKYGMSKQYIRQCLRGDRKSISADKIRADYKIIIQKTEPLIEIQQKTLEQKVETLIKNSTTL